MRPILLVVDDEPEILSLLSSTLTAEGFDVRVSTTAASFREINRREIVSLYLIDVNLPDGNGFSLVRELRADGGKGIILLTGRSSETDHVVGLEVGADDYVTKPFRLRELTARVNAVFRRTAQQTERPAPNLPTAKDPAEHPQWITTLMAMPVADHPRAADVISCIVAARCSQNGIQSFHAAAIMTRGVSQTA